MLDNGNLLYDREGITQLSGIRFVEPTFKIGWTYKKYGLTPSCFIRVWASYNNYQEIHERFINDDLASLRKFIEHPGLFLGKSLLYHPIPAWDWDNINIVRPIEKCAVPIDEMNISRDRVQRRKGETIGSNECRVLQLHPFYECSSLAPHAGHRCLDIKSIETFDEVEGSTGSIPQTHIFGIFADENSDVFVAPLVNFRQN